MTRLLSFAAGVVVGALAGALALVVYVARRVNREVYGYEVGL